MAEGVAAAIGIHGKITDPSKQMLLGPVQRYWGHLPHGPDGITPQALARGAQDGAVANHPSKGSHPCRVAVPLSAGVEAHAQVPSPEMPQDPVKRVSRSHSPAATATAVIRRRRVE